jgi:predicted transposase YdaD
MILPEGVEEKFWQELKTFEEERKVTYVTTGERIGFRKGKQEGALGLALRLLTRRIGPLESEAEQKIRTLSLIQLEELGEALLDFTTIADLENWLSTQ